MPGPFLAFSTAYTAADMADRRVCFFGDSFVQGAGDPSGLGWVGRVASAANAPAFWLTAYTLGIRGETSRALRNRWEGEAALRLDGHQGHVVFSFGTNDMVIWDGQVRVPVQESLEHARAILAGASARHPTLMISPPAMPDRSLSLRLARLVEALEQVCAELDVPFLNVLKPLSNNDTWLREAALGDGAHPAAGGYAAYAELVQAWPAWRAWSQSTRG